MTSKHCNVAVRFYFISGFCCFLSSGEIGQYLSSEPLASHPKNHCVRIHEVLDMPDSPNEIIIVMPLLRPYNDPRLNSVGEAVAFFRQIFEVGLGYHP